MYTSYLRQTKYWFSIYLFTFIACKFAWVEVTLVHTQADILSTWKLSEHIYKPSQKWITLPLWSLYISAASASLPTANVPLFTHVLLINCQCWQYLKQKAWVWSHVDRQRIDTQGLGSRNISSECGSLLVVNFLCRILSDSKVYNSYFIDSCFISDMQKRK